MRSDECWAGLHVYVWEDTFAIIKAKTLLWDAFAVIQDRREVTVALPEDQIQDRDVICIEKGWKLLTFDAVIPLSVVGFFVRVATALARENISIHPVSAYSTDHLLVKARDLPQTVTTLEGLGFRVTRAHSPA